VDLDIQAQRSLRRIGDQSPVRMKRVFVTLLARGGTRPDDKAETRAARQLARDCVGFRV